MKTKSNMIRMIAAFALVVLPSLSPASVFRKGEPAFTEKAVADFKNFEWSVHPGKAGSDRIQGRVEIKRRASSLIVVFHAKDSQNRHVATFGIEVTQYVSLPNEFAFAVSFEQDASIKKLQVANVVLDNDEIPYNLRIAGSALVRSMMKTPTLRGSLGGSFLNESQCGQWSPAMEKSAKEAGLQYTPSAKATNPMENRIAHRDESLQERDLVESKKFSIDVVPGDKKSIARLKRGDLLLVKFENGTCGRTIASRGSPDANGNLSPKILVKAKYNAGQPGSIEISKGTVAKPQAILCQEEEAEYLLEFPSRWFGRVTYSFVVVESGNVEAFLKSKAGKGIKLE